MEYHEEQHGETAKEAAANLNNVAKAKNNARLLDNILIDKANKQHWLYEKSTNHYEKIEDITKSSLHRTLEEYPASTMPMEIFGYEGQELLLKDTRL